MEDNLNAVHSKKDEIYDFLSKKAPKIDISDYVKPKEQEDDLSKKYEPEVFNQVDAFSEEFKPLIFEPNSDSEEEGPLSVILLFLVSFVSWPGVIFIWFFTWGYYENKEVGGDFHIFLFFIAFCAFIGVIIKFIKLLQK